MDVSTILPTAIWTFALTSLLIELTPGPNMTYLAIVAASRGRLQGFATVAGVALGLATIGVAGALGVSVLIQSSPVLYEGLRWAGFIFLLYLAWDAWRAMPEAPGATQPKIGQYFARGFLTNVLNPKAAVFYVAVLPTFLDEGKDVLGQTIILTAVYVSVATAIHVAIVVLAGSAQALLNNPAREQFIRRLLALLLAAVAVWFFVKTAA